MYNEYQHIEIGGVSYVGSTTLNLILGGLTGAYAVGESHWLVDMVERRRIEHNIEKKTLSLYSQDEYEKIFAQCRLCGSKCKYYTKEWRETLISPSQTPWVEKLFHKFQTKTIITSDKHPDIIRRLDSSLTNSTIVLFKHPYNAWMSYKKRGCSVEFFRHEYQYAYQRFLWDYQNKGSLIFLQWEQFLDKPFDYLRILCKLLKLPYDPDALKYWKNSPHYIGGNYNLYEKEHSSCFLKTMPYTTPEHSIFLNSIENSRLNVIYSNLKSKCINTTLHKLTI